jgi:hypothetical protein
MAIRVASFNGMVPELFTGTCQLQACGAPPAAAPNSLLVADPATEQIP